LLLAHPRGLPKPAQSAAQGDIRSNRSVSQHMVKLSGFP
jgi:hypothetical protein